MEYYQYYLRGLNRRLLTVSLILIFFWFAHNNFPIFPDPKSLLPYVISQVATFLAFMAWPLLFVSVFQVIINRFYYYSYNGEVRPKTFHFEITSFLKYTYLYTAVALLIPRVFEYISVVMDLQHPIRIAVVLLTQSFTLNLGDDTYSLWQSLIIGISIFILYLLQSFAFELIGVRDRRLFPGNRRSKFSETHNEIFRQIRVGGDLHLLVFMIVFLFWIFFTIFVVPVSAGKVIFAMLFLPFIVYFLHLLLRYLHYGWDKVFNVRDTTPASRTSYESREDWMESDAFRFVWEGSRRNSFFRVASRKKPKYSSSSFDMSNFGALPKFIWAAFLEAVFFVIVLSVAGLIMFSFHESFVRMIFSFDVISMLQTVYANSSWTWKAVLSGYLGWRALVRIGRFRIGLFDLLGGWLPRDD